MRVLETPPLQPKSESRKRGKFAAMTRAAHNAVGIMILVSPS